MRRALLLPLTALALLSARAAADPLPGPPAPSASFAVPKAHALGRVRVPGAPTVTLPAVGLQLDSGVGEALPGRPARLPTMDARLSPGQVARLEAVFSDFAGWLLVPRGWVAVAGGVGADGSGFLAFAPSRRANPAEWLLFTSTGACVGCALSAAGLFFPKWRAESQRQGFGAPSPDVPLKVVPLARSTAALFSYTRPGALQTDGVAAYSLDGQGIGGFRAAYATLRDRALAGIILNYALTHPWSGHLRPTPDSLARTARPAGGSTPVSRGPRTPARNA